MIKSDFQKFALSKGIGSNTVDEFNKYNFKSSYINPYVLEERQMNVTSLDVFSRLMLDRIIFLGTEINDDVANVISAQLLWLEQQGKSDVTMHLNTPGGSIYSGYSIVDTMNFISADISTVCMGMVASMGTIIASSGTKGKRFILPHTRYLIHQPLSGISQGTQASDIEIHTNEILVLKKELTQILADNSGQPYEQIEKWCDRDTIMTAQEAVERGFCDKVIART